MQMLSADTTCAISGRPLMPLKVLVAHDNEVVRSSIVRILKENPDVEVVGESINYAQTLVDALYGSVRGDQRWSFLPRQLSGNGSLETSLDRPTPHA